MAKISKTQADALRAARNMGADGIPGHAMKAQTRKSLLAMFAIVPSPHGSETYTITPTGGAYLDEYERAEKRKADEAERLSRPVPATAFVEPSAKSAPVMGLEYEDEAEDMESMTVAELEDEHQAASERRDWSATERYRLEIERRKRLESGNPLQPEAGSGAASCERHGPLCPHPSKCTPAQDASCPNESFHERGGVWQYTTCPECPADRVPQAWIDQLVTLLDADARIALVDGGRWAIFPPHVLSTDPDRVHAAACAAIGAGMAQALPATLNGTIRLALTDAYRQVRAAQRGVVVDAIVRYRAPLADKPGKIRMEVGRIEDGMAQCWPLEGSGESGARWVNLERLEPAYPH